MSRQAGAPPPAKPTSPKDSSLFGINGPAKRAMDLAIAVPAAIFLAPLFLIVSLAIFLESGGPVFYAQQRIGRGGKLFRMLKFRSMHKNAESLLEAHLAANPEARAEWIEFQKLRSDPRVTPLGRILRASSIDELPQIFNVIAGDMSIVGQRPILNSQRDALGPHIAGYERARPGITGLWQVSGRNGVNFARRAELGSEYVNDWSLLLDLRIIAMTVPAILLSKDAF
ncbi:MAG: sugar transferase [Hyphomonas sp.]